MEQLKNLWCLPWYISTEVNMQLHYRGPLIIFSRIINCEIPICIRLSIWDIKCIKMAKVGNWHTDNVDLIAGDKSIKNKEI